MARELDVGLRIGARLDKTYRKTVDGVRKDLGGLGSRARGAGGGPPSGGAPPVASGKGKGMGRSVRTASAGSGIVGTLLTTFGVRGAAEIDKQAADLEDVGLTYEEAQGGRVVLDLDPIHPAV